MSRAAVRNPILRLLIYYTMNFQSWLTVDAMDRLKLPVHRAYLEQRQARRRSPAPRGCQPRSTPANFRSWLMVDAMDGRSGPRFLAVTSPKLLVVCAAKDR